MAVDDLFCTVHDIEAFLQIKVDEPSAMRAITEASSAIRRHCRQVIGLVEDDEYTFDVPPRRSVLFLPELPVVEVSSVIEDGEALVEGSDQDYQLGLYGVLHRIGTFWASGIQIVTVTYTHGLADDDYRYQTARDVCTRAASRAYQAGLRAADAAGIAGIAAKSLGDFSVQFGAETGGGVSEGVMGASAARLLLLSEKDELALAYRRP